MLYCYDKKIYNLFMILAIHKFCYFKLVVLPLYYNHQYHADFNTCHDLHDLIVEEHIAFLIHRQSSDMHHHTHLFKQKGKFVCLQRELKTGQHKSYPSGGEDDELVIAIGHPLCQLRCRDGATILDIVVVK
jgi:hypothetical protein